MIIDLSPGESAAEYVARHTPPRIGLVGCGAQKSAKRCEAREMYTSQLFRFSRAYVEATCDRWFILSAHHGLLEPTTVIAPYNLRLTVYVVKAWGWGARVGQQLAQLGPAQFVALAGAPYVEAIEGDFSIEQPLRGMGIGRRLGWLSNALKQPNSSSPTRKAR